MPPHLKKSINQVHLENGTYEQILSHLQREFELNGLEAQRNSDGNVQATAETLN